MVKQVILFMALLEGLWEGGWYGRGGARTNEGGGGGIGRVIGMMTSGCRDGLDENVGRGG